ncbi:XRE family transcriptional regulator [Virgibacillus sp. CM-4]|uniref:HTH-type transcriptional regulator ImmR n=1 Tax=Virgibacillus massiliensis TaxID=1462526 RepID=A0A024QH31_9BACI|nr:MULTISPECIES: helix-turn-helix transcriptional regulator [Virgibacillus]EQB34638.1 XRE family transcriptional regulator [Virgibacillus sp. CM-4]CDQ41470.1 HTH-type transcriptional regulator ImmR [Virgibacillus massiliensis]
MLGKRMRHLRERENLSQLQLAKKLNIPNQSISNYERGFRNPDYETLNKIADFFEVTTDYLLGRSDQPHMTEDEAFEAFRHSEELKRWYKKLPESSEEDLLRLKKVWEAFKEFDD